jgi:hypothetical protein
MAGPLALTVVAVAVAMAALMPSTSAASATKSAIAEAVLVAPRSTNHATASSPLSPSDALGACTRGG